MGLRSTFGGALATIFDRVSEDRFLGGTGRSPDQWILALRRWGATPKQRDSGLAWLMDSHGLNRWWAMAVWDQFEKSVELKEAQHPMPCSMRSALMRAGGLDHRFFGLPRYLQRELISAVTRADSIDGRSRHIDRCIRILKS